MSNKEKDFIKVSILSQREDILKNVLEFLEDHSEVKIDLVEIEKSFDINSSMYLDFLISLEGEKKDIKRVKYEIVDIFEE